jgi:hypothetical protein
VTVPTVVPDTGSDVDVSNVRIADERMRARLPLELNVRAVGGWEYLDSVFCGSDRRALCGGPTGGHLGVLKEQFDDLDLPLDYGAVVRGEDESLLDS